MFIQQLVKGIAEKIFLLFGHVPGGRADSLCGYQPSFIGLKFRNCLPQPFQIATFRPPFDTTYKDTVKPASPSDIDDPLAILLGLNIVVPKPIAKSLEPGFELVGQAASYFLKIFGANGFQITSFNHRQDFIQLLFPAGLGRGASAVYHHVEYKGKARKFKSRVKMVCSQFVTNFVPLNKALSLQMKNIRGVSFK